MGKCQTRQFKQWAARRRGSIATGLVGVTLAGCAGTTTTTVTAPQQGNSAAQASSGTGDTSTTGHSDLNVGSSDTLTGNNNEQIKVTVTHIQDPATGGDIDQPNAGNRYVGVELMLDNVGSVAYNDSPGNGAKLVDSTGQNHDDEVTSGGSCNSPGTITIEPGNTQQVCIPFQVPTSANPRYFQFALSSGFADQTDQWNVSSTSGGSTSSDTSGTLPQHCSAGIDAAASVSCDLASNVFYEYWKATQNGGSGTTLSAWSPANKQYYNVSCSSAAGSVKCTISGTSDPHAEVDLTQDALSAYSSQQASSFAANHDVGPKG